MRCTQIVSKYVFAHKHRDFAWRFYFEVVIELIDEQPDIYGYTMEMVFVGCHMDYELTPIINFVNSKID